MYEDENEDYDKEGASADSIQGSYVQMYKGGM